MGFVNEQKCRNFEKKTLAMVEQKCRNFEKKTLAVVEQKLAVVEQKLAVVEPVETTHPYRIFLKL